MGGNPHASLLMGTNAHGAVASEVRNVVDKTVVREFQAVLMSLHAYFFNSPDDLRAKAFVDHMLSPSKTPIEETILQTYAKYMADHLVKPTLAGMKLLVYVFENCMEIFYSVLFKSNRTIIVMLYVYIYFNKKKAFIKINLNVHLI